LRLTRQEQSLKILRIPAFIVLATIAGTSIVSAQNVRGFVTGGVISDVNHQRFPSAGGGVLVDVGQPWLSFGAQGETFWQWPYFARRGTVFGQANLIPKGRIRPFVLGGGGFGETAGPMLGGGVELRPPNGGPGLRVSVEDYLVRIGGLDCASYGLQSYCDENPRAARGYTEHQVTVRVGVLF
jgi:hypothetical protein